MDEKIFKPEKKNQKKFENFKKSYRKNERTS